MTPFFLLTTVLLLASPPAFADTAKPAELTAEERIELTRIEDYLTGIGTAKAPFEQYGTNGGKTTGTFYLSRPGRLRFDYASPNKDIVVADGKFIWFYDAQMKEANHAPLNRTLANFLLRDNVELTGGAVRVTDYAQQDKTIAVTATQTDDPGQGSLTLLFNQQPLRLTGWQVLDAQGKQTRVVLHNFQTGMSLDPQLFIFKEPD